MTMTPATWFDGHCGEGRVVDLEWEGSWLALYPADGEIARFPAAAIRSEPPFAGLPRVIELAGAGNVHAPADAPWPAAPSRLSVLGVARHWWSALLCAALLVGVVIALDQVVIGQVAEGVMGWLPTSVDRRIGDKVMEGADKSWLQSSALSGYRMQRLRERFENATAGSDAHLSFRRLRGVDPGYNAFALPGNTVVVLDGLVWDLTDDEVMWVLGHELGHLAHRHGMRGLLRTFGIGALATVLWGDLSGWVAIAGAALPMQAHRRDAEREADEWMREFGRRNGLPIEAQVSMWEKLKAKQERSGAGAIPLWLSTHPPTEERLKAAQQAPSTR